jgi:hypothetical protein
LYKDFLKIDESIIENEELSSDDENAIIDVRIFI